MSAPATAQTKRLAPEVFELPVAQIRDGFYTDKYFLYARSVVLGEDTRRRVTMQVFQKKHALLSGIDEAIALLKLCLTAGFAWSDLEVRALREGDTIDPWESVMHITGPYAAFAHLETLYLGALARGTRVATNTRRVVDAAWPKPVIFFPARHDHWSVQRGDGWAAHIAGATGVSTDAQASYFGASGIGTVPHALIASFGGNTLAAVQAFVRNTPEHTRLIPLVDFNNDSVGTALELARALGDRLWGVRLDTSESMVDKSLADDTSREKLTGVNARLVQNVRNALDAEGYHDVKIVVSGGFNVEKIQSFMAEDVPADAFGVGSSLFKETYDFTADIVLLEGEPAAKAGREYKPSDRLEPVR